MSTTLHYIHDPLCGWCYGAAPLLRAARELVTVVGHGGGMMAGNNRQKVSPQLRNYVMPHDRRIAQLTGQPFGEAYFEDLLRDDSAVFDSEPPIAAVLAADQVAQRGLELLARLQVAHYQEGRCIADTVVLTDLATEIGLDPETFTSALAHVSGEPTRAHIAESRALLARVGGSGFPTFAMEQDGLWTVIDIAPYLGQTDLWKSWLRQSVGASPATPTDATFACGPDGCAL